MKMKKILFSISVSYLPKAGFMKKALFLSFATLLLFTIQSCQRDWNCICTFAVLDKTINDTVSINNTTRIQATNSCERIGVSMSQRWDIKALVGNVSCSIDEKQ
jgi:hypothetical protein